MYGTDPRPTVFGALEARLVIHHATHDGSREEDLCELSAGIEGIGANVGIYFVDRGEVGGGEGGAVEVRGLEDKAGVGRCLEGWKEGEGEKHLGEVVDLEVRVWRRSGYYLAILKTEEWCDAMNYT